MRTIQLTASAIALMTLSGAALAERPDFYNDRARVLSSTPIYQQVSQPASSVQSKPSVAVTVKRRATTAAR
jgi:hypothetical protein